MVTPREFRSERLVSVLDIAAPEKTTESLGKILLAPLYLIYDLSTAALPGLLFCVLLIVKGTPAPAAAMGNMLFGYKTKVFLGLVLSYMIGRAFRLPIEQLTSFLLVRKFSQMSRGTGGPSAIQILKD